MLLRTLWLAEDGTVKLARSESNLSCLFTTENCPRRVRTFPAYLSSRHDPQPLYPGQLCVLFHLGKINLYSCTLEHSGEGDLNLTSPLSELRHILLPWRLWTEPQSGLRSSSSCHWGGWVTQAAPLKQKDKVQPGNLILIPP